MPCGERFKAKGGFSRSLTYFHEKQAGGTLRDRAKDISPEYLGFLSSHVFETEFLM